MAVSRNGSVMLAPGIRRATEAVYRVVAQNRHRLPGVEVRTEN